MTSDPFSTDFSSAFGSGAPAVSNLHVGLAGWSNTTYTVGQRRSNAGNAYQVTTGGTSTSPPTGTGTGINNGGTSVWTWLSAIDYTTVQAWYTAIVTTLTQPVVGLLWNDAVITATAGTALLVASGKTTTSTNTIILMPAPGEGFQDKFAAAPTTAFAYNNANGVSFEMPASGTGPSSYFQINDNFVTLKGLQFKDLNPISAASIIGGSGTNLHVDQCIIEGRSQASGDSFISTTASILLTNSLIVDDAVAPAGNVIQDSTNIGAVIGTVGGTGSLPTLANGLNSQWNLFNVTGATVAVAGFGTTSGRFPYIDISVSGTCTSGIIQISHGWCTASASVPYTYSPYLQLMAGNFTNVTGVNLGFDDTTGTLASPSYLSTPLFTGIANPTGTLTRFSGTATSAATTTTIIPYVYIQTSTTLPLSFTLRIAGVKLEQGSSATAFDLTPNVLSPTLLSNGVFTLANNTFIRGAVQATSSALSSGTNTTSASNVATNNIFYNYDLPFFAASGTPWSTNHNAYTAASFTGNNGTDTGGSVYGITGSATFVSATTDFHLKSGASIQNAGATDTTDIPGAIDIFNASRPQGTNWDIGAHELLVGSVIFRDAIASAAFGATWVVDKTASAEFKLGIGFTAVAFPAEWRVGIFNDSVDTVDWRSSFTLDKIVPVEWQSGTMFPIGDAVVTLEWRSAYSIDRIAASEWSASRMADGAAPIVWQRSHAIDTTALADWRSSLALDVPASIAWQATTPVGPLPPIDTTFPLEWKSLPVRDAIAAAEFGLSVVQTAVVPVETTSLRIMDITAPADPGATGRLDAAIASEWSAGMVISATAPLEFVLAVMRDVRIPAETNLAVVSDAAMQPGYMLNLARDMVLWIEPLIGTAADARAPMEFGGGAAFGSDAAVPLEWRSGIFQDGTIGVEARATLSANTVFAVEASFPHVIDAPFGIVWASGLAVAANVPAEWGHLTAGVVSDTAFPLEIKATIAADITVSITGDIGREAIGSGLEPDEWEDKHEP